MSESKTRKKLAFEKRAQFNKAAAQELKLLREQALVLEEKVKNNKKDKLKQFHVRNLKIFKATCKFIAPIILTTGVTVGTFAFVGAGTPFHLDKITKYKACNLDYKSNGYTEMEEFYKSNNWYNDPLPESSMTVYTPWEKYEDKYIRYKRKYEFDKIRSMDLLNAVLNNDFDYINDIEEYIEETQITNKLYDEDNNGYELSVSLYALLEEDKLKYDESNVKNIIVTSLELIIIIGISGQLIYFKGPSYVRRVKSIKESYKSKLEEYKTEEEELASINKKILKLSKKVRK